MAKKPIIFCEISDATDRLIHSYAAELRSRAHEIGDHGLSHDEFWSSGIFHGAIETIRGSRAAGTETKREFMRDILDHMKTKKLIGQWSFTGSAERHDYEVTLPAGKRVFIETKGCLDGNNTNIFERPPGADEFYIWSLCQNPGSDPQHNAWSGIQTRLSAELIHKKQRVDAVIIWDMLCGTRGRPCPKIDVSKRKSNKIGNRLLPPPCIYLFPRTIPDPRNNPQPSPWSLHDMEFAGLLYRCFGGSKEDVVSVTIATRMNGPDVERQCLFARDGKEFSSSSWAAIRRAR